MKEQKQSDSYSFLSIKKNMQTINSF